MEYKRAEYYREILGEQCTGLKSVELFVVMSDVELRLLFGGKNIENNALKSDFANSSAHTLGHPLQCLEWVIASECTSSRVLVLRKGHNNACT